MDGKRALEIISQFLTKEWAKLEPEDIEVTHLSYMNTIHKVERKNGGNLEEPNALVIRTTGSEESKYHQDPKIREEMMKMTEAEEMVAFAEMSRLKRCPRLIGVFPGGRVEEYRKIRFITREEVLVPELMQDIAKAFARMHSMNLPLSRDKWEPFWDIAQEGYKKRPLTDWMEKYANGIDVSASMSLNYHEEVVWLRKVMRKYFNNRSRTGFIQADTHYKNLVVNEEPREGELKVFLLDYEISSYGPRGLDLGAHFFAREANFTIPEYWLNRMDMHNEEQRIAFLKYYQEEVKRLGYLEDFDEDGLDSVDNLLFESYIGALMYHMFFMYIAFNIIGEKRAKERPGLVIAPNYFATVYIKSKKLAIQKYPFLDPKLI